MMEPLDVWLDGPLPLRQSPELADTGGTASPEQRARAAALWKALNTPVEDVQRAAGQAAQLEGAVATERARAASERAAAADLRQRLDDAESDRFPSVVVYALVGLVVALALLAAWLWGPRPQGGGLRLDRSRRCQQPAPGARRRAAGAGKLRAGDPAAGRGARRASEAPARDAQPGVGFRGQGASGAGRTSGAPAGCRPGRAGQLPPSRVRGLSFRRGAGRGAGDDAQRAAGSRACACARAGCAGPCALHGTGADGGARARRGAPAWRARSPKTCSTSSSRRNSSCRWASTTRPSPCSGSTSPPMEIPRHSPTWSCCVSTTPLGRVEGFHQLREQFCAQFNVSVPEFGNFHRSGKTLQGFPDALAAIEAEWSSPAVLGVIEGFLFRQADAPKAAQFDLAAFDDLLLLLAIAQTTPASARGPAPPRPRTTPNEIPADEVQAAAAPVRAASAEPEEELRSFDTLSAGLTWESLPAPLPRAPSTAPSPLHEDPDAMLDIDLSEPPHLTLSDLPPVPVTPPPAPGQSVGFGMDEKMELRLELDEFDRKNRTPKG
ncbi:hypothetical protein GO496_05520 [Acidovorax citrulli]|nr:hypothetical protein [Paracidovorax citrulli]